MLEEYGANFFLPARDQSRGGYISNDEALNELYLKPGFTEQKDEKGNIEGINYNELTFDKTTYDENTFDNWVQEHYKTASQNMKEKGGSGVGWVDKNGRYTGGNDPNAAFSVVATNISGTNKEAIDAAQQYLTDNLYSQRDVSKKLGDMFTKEVLETNAQRFAENTANDAYKFSDEEIANIEAYQDNKDFDPSQLHSAQRKYALSKISGAYNMYGKTSKYAAMSGKSSVGSDNAFERQNTEEWKMYTKAPILDWKLGIQSVPVLGAEIDKNAGISQGANPMWTKIQEDLKNDAQLMEAWAKVEQADKGTDQKAKDAAEKNYKDLRSEKLKAVIKTNFSTMSDADLQTLVETSTGITFGRALTKDELQGIVTVDPRSSKNPQLPPSGDLKMLVSAQNNFKRWARYNLYVETYTMSPETTFYKNFNGKDISTLGNKVYINGTINDVSNFEMKPIFFNPEVYVHGMPDFSNSGKDMAGVSGYMLVDEEDLKKLYIDVPDNSSDTGYKSVPLGESGFGLGDNRSSWGIKYGVQDIGGVDDLPDQVKALMAGRDFDDLYVVPVITEARGTLSGTFPKTQTHSPTSGAGELPVDLPR